MLSSNFRNSLATGLSSRSFHHGKPYFVIKTRFESALSFGEGRTAVASSSAAIVSGHKGQRRSTAVFGRGKSTQHVLKSIADSGSFPQSALPKPQLMPNRIMALSG